MENLFANKRFYPQHFFIRKNEDTDIEAIVRKIAESAYSLSPDLFNSETKHFIYKLRYQPPYVKIREFYEIKNLQIEAISKTRYKDEYNGYIGIDISEWIEHSDEEHFINCIHALSEMSRYWKYVFFADDSFYKADINKTVDFIRCEIWLRELNINSFSKSTVANRLSRKLKETHDISLPSTSENVIDYVFPESDRMDDSTVSNIANDISVYFKDTKAIKSDALIDYLSDDTYGRFTMTEKQLTRLNDLITERGDKR